MMDELLSLIKENPRLTNAELAAALDRDEAQVAQQVRQYEADGVIKGYCAILDKEKAGDETVTALIEIKVQPKFGHGFDDIARRIAALEEVESIFLMSGGYDLCCLVTDVPIVLPGGVNVRCQPPVAHGRCGVDRHPLYPKEV